MLRYSLLPIPYSPNGLSVPSSFNCWTRNSAASSSAPQCRARRCPSSYSATESSSDSSPDSSRATMSSNRAYASSKLRVISWLTLYLLQHWPLVRAGHGASIARQRIRIREEILAAELARLHRCDQRFQLAGCVERAHLREVRFGVLRLAAAQACFGAQQVGDHMVRCARDRLRIRALGAQVAAQRARRHPLHEVEVRAGREVH